MSDHGFTDIERKIICAQIERRAKYREEFLRLRTDPCKNAMEAGYVFDHAHQRFLSLKVTRFEYFYPNSKNLMFLFTSLGPMVIYGYFVWKQRTKFQQDCQCGRIKYKDRLHKLQ